MLPFYAESSEIKEDDILKNEKRKEETVRIILQALHNLGYKKTEDLLKKESAIEVEDESLQQFRGKILSGNWEEAVALLPALRIPSPEKIKEASSLIYQQNYLELLEKNDLENALNVLRNQIVLTTSDPSLVHKLASLVICRNIKEINNKIGFSGAGTASRNELLAKIQKKCRPAKMMEAHKLEMLCMQSINYQIIGCKYHKKLPKDYSLIEPHICKKDSVPSVVLETIKKMDDEIWIVKFSPNGKYLVAVSKSSSVGIWSINLEDLTFNEIIVLQKVHAKEINNISWSSDSSMFLTASADKAIKLWKASNGELIKVFNEHKEIITGVVWHPNNTQFFSGSIDPMIFQWSLFSGEASYISKSLRVSDLLISPDGHYLYAVCSGINKVTIIEINKKTEIANIVEKDNIISANISKDGRYLILNTSYKYPELHLWDLKTYEMLNRYTGHFQEKFVLRCSFGGTKDRFIACGSEDSKIYIWHRNLQKPVADLSDHASSVNCIAWHPVIPQLIASASDDYTIKIWSSVDIKKNYPRKPISFFCKMRQMFSSIAAVQSSAQEKFMEEEIKQDDSVEEEVDGGEAEEQENEVDEEEEDEEGDEEEEEEEEDPEEA